MKKMIVGAALCVATVAGLGAGPAMAGEITGNNTRPMVIGESGGHMILNAKSLCAFSGLNDEFIEGGKDPSEPRVQTPAGSRGAPRYACNPSGR